MNIASIMKQAQQMQKKIQESQSRIEKMEFSGSASNDAVVVKMQGTGLVSTIQIDKNLLNSDDKEMLEDLLMIAFNDARKKLDSATKASTSDATGGLI